MLPIGNILSFNCPLILAGPLCSLVPCNGTNCFTLYIGTGGAFVFGSLNGMRSRIQTFPAASLLAPVRESGDRQNMPKLNQVTAFNGAWQE